jgi:hydroxymethylpyrimidine/phosphomethylpyrimidine kinase
VRGDEDVHGTGCALSTAIATYLAQGHELVEACRHAKELVARMIEEPVRPGRGAPAVL